MVLPLVSCILPTRNRAAFVPDAIRSYQSQTYPNKELIVLDQGEDATESLIPPDPSISYARVSPKLTTGDMRNACVTRARGQWICHFDSDDWSAPERVMEQVTRLGTFGVVTGYYSMLFYDTRSGKTYLWHTPQNAMYYLLGTSLCYQRRWWEHHPFRSISIGEDVRFVQQAMREAFKLVPGAAAGQMMVARVHDHQTSRKNLTRSSYQLVGPTSLPKAFPRAL
jgi:glycosyltransferase involved in cell wall biosynthesis